MCFNRLFKRVTSNPVNAFPVGALAGAAASATANLYGQELNLNNMVNAAGPSYKAGFWTAHAALFVSLSLYAVCKRKSKVAAESKVAPTGESTFSLTKQKTM